MCDMKNAEFSLGFKVRGFGASCVAFGRLRAPSLAFWNDSKHLESVFGGFVGGLGGSKGLCRGAREGAWWSLGALWEGLGPSPGGPLGRFLRVYERDWILDGLWRMS